MKRVIQLTILLGVALFLLSACAQETAVEPSTETVTEETIVLEPTEQEIEPVQEEESSEEIKEEDDTSPPIPEGEVIQITSSGFSPSSLTVTKGTTVTFITMDEGSYWPASASHPSHTVYPTTGGCIGSTFDACKKLAQGETFEFTFDEVGSWNYHDHSNPSLFGTIIVE